LQNEASVIHIYHRKFSYTTWYSC